MSTVKEQMNEKIKKIVTNEKFKLDAYFLCGAPSGLPNKDLQVACEKYLAVCDGGDDYPKAKEGLIKQLEKTLSTEPEIKVVGDIGDNRAMVQEVYDNREFL